MTTPRETIRVNEKRFLEDFSRLTRDGATPEGGLNRPALSEAHLAARETFRNMIWERGFRFREDTAGNLFRVLCSPQDRKTRAVVGLPS